MEMKNDERIAAILAKIRGRGHFNPIKRFRYDISTNDCVAIMDAIGKERNPKFVIDRENRFAYENIIKWMCGDTTAQAINPDTHEIVPANMKAGIFIAGNTGTGKSWCMELMREMTMALGYRIVINDEERPLSWCIVRADDVTDAFMRDGSIGRYREMDILCIQDVGTEARETLYMGNRVEVIRSLLEWRGDNADKLTFITSNIPMTHEQFKERYGDRVVSRLRQMCNYYEIKGKDRRKL